MEFTFPIFVRAKDCGDVLKFCSMDEIKRELEAIDITNGEYDAWDKDGLPLDLKVQRPTWLKIEAASSDFKLEELIGAISGFGSQNGVRAENVSSVEIDAEALFDSIIAKLNQQET